MRINWVFASGYNPDPTLDLEALKSVAPSWGSWQTWRACGTDNVICHDLSKCNELITRSFQNSCNFYIPRKYFQDLNRPQNVKLYDGDFKEQLDNIEDVIAMQLVTTNSDIVLLAGFDFSKPETNLDRFEQHKLRNRHGIMYHTIASNPEIQWVIVDHPGDLDTAYSKLPNITCDQMTNVLQLLV